MASNLQEHINKAIEAAEHGAKDVVETAIALMTSRDFASKKIVFDLQGNYFGSLVKEMLEEIIGEKTDSSFQGRVCYVKGHLGAWVNWIVTEG